MHNAVNLTPPAANPGHTYMMIFYHDEIAVKNGNGRPKLPSMLDVINWSIEVADAQYVGSLNGAGCYGMILRSPVKLAGGCFEKLAQLPGRIGSQALELVFRAFHIINWAKSADFCGRCGERMLVPSASRAFARQCAACGCTVYPRISPAVIVAVVKEDEILLARPNRFPPLHHSVLSGFINPGETLENCVRRELREEVGIVVDQIRYFGSQPWPFPDVLMIAFTARYVSGEIAVNQSEILSAGWFSADNLPAIPAYGGIARQLIDWFANKD